MIRVKNLTKDYGGRKGIFDLSFEVENGEVFGLLGPEGAGKTTVISQLLGFASASRGRCFINGKSCHTRSAEIMEFTGYLPEEISLPEDMTGLAFVRFMGSSVSDLVNNRKNAQKGVRGVKIDMTGAALVLDLYLTVQYGNPIPEVAGNAQKAVSSAVEAMTGCAVEAVNIHVGGVTLN